MPAGLPPRALALLVAVVMLAASPIGVATAHEPEAVPEDVAPDVPMAAHPQRVVDYTLRATLDPAVHTLHGEGTIAWTNVSTRPVSELWMHLYLNAFKNQSSVFMRAPVGG